MTSEQAEQIVLLSTAVTLGSTTFRALKKTEHPYLEKNLPDTKILVGGFFAMTICAAVAEFAPELGAYLSVAIAGTAFISYGLPALNSYFGPEKKKAKK